MPLLWNLLRDGNDVELPNIWSAVCKREESEGSKGWRDGDNEGVVLFVWEENTCGCTVYL